MTSLAQPRRALGEIGNRIANNQTRIAQDGKPVGAVRTTTTVTSTTTTGLHAAQGVLAASNRASLIGGVTRRMGVAAPVQPRQPAPTASVGMPGAALPTLRTASAAPFGAAPRLPVPAPAVSRPPTSSSVSSSNAAPTPAAAAPVAPPPQHQELGSFEDIDINDAGNPQACSEYVQEIYEYLRELEAREKIPENFLSIQTEVTDRMRATVEVHARFQLLPETLFLAINVLDRFLAAKLVAQAKLQLVGVAALLVAAKYEETYYPLINDFVRATNRSCSKADLIRTERLLLSSLKFSLSVPTVLSFLKRYAKAAMANNTIGMLSRFMAELSMMDAHICSTYVPSIVAAAAIYHALRCTHNTPWTPTLQHYSGYSEADITPCANELRELVRRTPGTKLQTIYTKYSQEKYLGVAVLCVAKI